MFDKVLNIPVNVLVVELQEGLRKPTEWVPDDPHLMHIRRSYVQVY